MDWIIIANDTFIAARRNDEDFGPAPVAVVLALAIGTAGGTLRGFQQDLHGASEDAIEAERRGTALCWVVKRIGGRLELNYRWAIAGGLLGSGGVGSIMYNAFIVFDFPTVGAGVIASVVSAASLAALRLGATCYLRP